MGSVVAGKGDGALGTFAFRWTAATGMVNAGGLANSQQPVAVSGDGSVIVGTGGSSQVARWTSATGMVSIGCAAGAFSCSANAISANGAVVVGEGPGSVSWSSAAGWTALGSIAGGQDTTLCCSGANAVNAVGSVIVGGNQTQSGGQREAFIWTARTGMLSLTQVLLSDGISLNGWFLGSATGVSADGTSIVGTGVDPEGRTEAWMLSGLTQDDLGATPIPAALPLFATGLGALGLIGWRRKRRIVQEALQPD